MRPDSAHTTGRPLSPLQRRPRSGRGQAFKATSRAASIIVAVLAFLAWCRANAQVAPLPDHNLVNVRTIQPPLLQEIRYATAYNFTGRILYPFPAVFVQKDVAAALQKIQLELSAEGLGLKIYDGYRPLAVQGLMWAAVPDERYVSDPSKSRGRHTRGVAVDVTLVDRLGNELAMPTSYDDFTEKAHRASTQWTREQRENSHKLEAVMKKHGFIPFPFEWWHFDFHDWEKYPPLNISFEDLARGVKVAEPVR